MLLTDSSGNKSLTHTVTIVAFIVVMVKVLFGGNQMVWGSYSFSFGTIDSFSIAAILTPTLGAYVARRYPPAAADDDPGTGAKAGNE